MTTSTTLTAQQFFKTSYKIEKELQYEMEEKQMMNSILIKVGTACFSVVAGLKVTELIGKGIEKIVNKTTV
jgi:hypothetical protein